MTLDNDGGHENDESGRPPSLARVDASATSLTVEICFSLRQDLTSIEQAMDSLPKPQRFSNLTSFLCSSAITLWFTIWFFAEVPKEKKPWLVAAACFISTLALILGWLDNKRRTEHERTIQLIRQCIAAIKGRVVEQTIDVKVEKKRLSD